MLWVVRYEMLAADRAGEVHLRHAAYLDAFARGGEVVVIGPLLPAPTSGALSVFRSRDAADRFVAGDPFVREGVVRAAAAQEWDATEFLGPAPW